ncbi:PREDICTED: protein FAM229A isoform X2 [Condylura cristata]|uniref:protein FAM229A isoform X2 n=1 Tax=Condylura cristata TaxID=143302 RepID=UPI000642E141|nr:PREDICTED: protein FAM229A isoform X2 [Condylura cristata]
MQPSPSTLWLGRAADTCPAPPGPECPPAARARAAASSLGPASASGRAPRGRDMSAQEPPQGRRFPIEAGDSPGLAAAPESQDSPEPVATEHNPVRPLRPASGAPAAPCFPGHFAAARAATA